MSSLTNLDVFKGCQNMPIRLQQATHQRHGTEVGSIQVR